MSEQSFLGLGAARAPSSSSSSSPRWKNAGGAAATPKRNDDDDGGDKPGTVPSSTTGDDTNCTNNAADELVSRYMKQCLDYHNEQVRLEKIRRESQQQQQQQQQQQHQNGLDDTVHNAATISSSTPPPNVIPPLPPPATTPTAPTVTIISNRTIPATTTITQESPPGTTAPTHEDELRTRITNARAIARRLASTAPPPAPAPAPTTRAATDPHPTTNTTAATNGTSAQKRAYFLNHVHRKRLQASLLKNLDYLVLKDTELHQRQLETLQRTRDREVGLRLRDDRVLSERRRLLLQQQTRAVQGRGTGARKRNRFGGVPKPAAGIGTHERKSAQRHNTAVYVTGLPRGGAGDGGNGGRTAAEAEEVEKDALEKVLQRLFASYGIVSRVSLYVNKGTGRRKGDGLVVYDCPKQSDDGGGTGGSDGCGGITGGRDSFLEMVCSQLNGVELPCGSILSVEPADMDYKNKDELKKKSSNSSNINMTRTDEHEIGTISSTATSVLKDDRVGLNMAMDDRSAEEEKGGDDDLDDFFASLE